MGIAISNYLKAQEKRINVLGISLGNAPAYKFADFFHVERFVSVVSGSLLPECIWESIATKKIAENLGRTLDDYREALDDFSPIKNLGNLKANSLEIYLGRYDKTIPYKRGRELIDEMRIKGLNPEVTTYSFSGHCETVLSFARNFEILQQ